MIVLSHSTQSACPTCGQRVLTRHGVRLSPRLADLFDMIEHSAERGTLCETLAWVFYPGKSTRDAKRCVITNINHLNSFLEETGVRIDGGHIGSEPKPYRVVRRP
jgi:hypothetical protein